MRKKLLVSLSLALLVSLLSTVLVGPNERRGQCHSIL